MNYNSTKYLYISKASSGYNKLNARLASTKLSTRKNEICLKLCLEVPEEALKDSIPTVTLSVPTDIKKRVINLRVG